MAKSYSSKKDALDDLESLGKGEVVVICGEYYRVEYNLLGKCFKRITIDTSDCFPTTKSVDRTFTKGKKNQSGCQAFKKEFSED